jgi:hypothetical protein
MDNILGATLCEVRGLFKDLNDKLCGEDWQKWLEALKLFLRGEPVWTDGMIHIPLEWSIDLGQVNYALIQERINLYDEHEGVVSRGWRLPTERELARALKLMKLNFIAGEYFWSSTIESNSGYKIIRTNAGGGLEYSSSRCFFSAGQKYPRLRLCRSMTVEAF